MGKRKKIKALRAQIEELTERLPDKDDLFDQPKKKRGFLRKVLRRPADRGRRRGGRRLQVPVRRSAAPALLAHELERSDDSPSPRTRAREHQ